MAESPFYTNGWGLVKHFHANYLYNRAEKAEEGSSGSKQLYEESRRLYEDLLIVYPNHEQVSDIRERLLKIEEIHNTPRFQEYRAMQLVAVKISCLIAIIAILLILLLDWKSHEFRLVRRKEQVFERLIKASSNTLGQNFSADTSRQSRMFSEKTFGRLDWHRNDPLAFLIESWNPSYLRLFLLGVGSMIGLHYIVAFIDGNLLLDQSSSWAIGELLRPDFGQMYRTFITIPTDRSRAGMEYFFNDYYGFLVNGIINPLSLVAIIAAYRRFGDVWNTLLNERTITFRDKRVVFELCDYVIRSFNKRWYFWISFGVPSLVTFWYWYHVYNQPHRASYLDFDQSVMPFYHGLYLTVMWYMVAMLVIKACVSVRIIKNIFGEWVDEKKIVLTLRPLHPDNCAGLSSLGHYALSLHLFVLLQAISISLRIYFDFVMVGTSIMTQPAVLFGLGCLIVGGPVLFFMPLYFVRGRILLTKQDALRRLHEIYAVNRDDCLRRVRKRGGLLGEQEVTTLDAMRKVSEVHQRLAKIPTWPFDLRTFRALQVTLFLPLALPLILELLKNWFSLS